MRKGVNPTVYWAWLHMKDRCRNPNDIEYYAYGGRGITYTPRWESYDNFKKDMEPTWFLGARLDRRDNEGNYEPSNCQWVNKTISSRNRSYVKLTLTLAEEIRELWATGKYTQKALARQYNVSRQTIGYIVRDQSWL